MRSTTPSSIEWAIDTANHLIASEGYRFPKDNADGSTVLMEDDARTPARERKRILRLLIQDVTLLRDDVITMSIRWKGGATSVVERPLPKGAPDLRRTPAAIVEQVRALATEHTEARIASTLNGRWLRTGTGQAFSRLRVRAIREAYGIESYGDYLQRAGWLTAAAVAQQLHIHHTTAKRFAHEGVLEAVHADDSGLVLFAPLTGPLPVAHPGKRFRDRRRHPQLAFAIQEAQQYQA